jgi:hypothetical protein
MRYEVRIITDLGAKVTLGRTLFASDSEGEAKEYADEHGTEETHGLAIEDTANQTVDMGDRVIDYLHDTKEDLYTGRS